MTDPTEETLRGMIPVKRADDPLTPQEEFILSVANRLQTQREALERIAECYPDFTAMHAIAVLAKLKGQP